MGPDDPGEALTPGGSTQSCSLGESCLPMRLISVCITGLPARGGHRSPLTWGPLPKKLPFTTATGFSREKPGNARLMHTNYLNSALQ